MTDTTHGAPLSTRLSLTSSRNTSSRLSINPRPPALNLTPQIPDAQAKGADQPTATDDGAGGGGDLAGRSSAGQWGHLQPKLSASSMSHFGQRLQQRRPKGLQLNISGSGGLSQKEMPPPTAAGANWDSSQLGQKPLNAHQGSSTWSVPQTPITATAGSFGPNGQQGYHRNRFIAVIGASRGNGSLGDGGVTPSDLPGSLNLFRKDLTSAAVPLSSPLSLTSNSGPASSPSATAAATTATGVPPALSGLGRIGAGFSGRAFAQRAQQQQQQQVQGLNFISSCDLAAKLAVPEPGLVIDMRKTTQYTTSRIATAISMSAPTTLVKRRTFSVERLLGMLLVSDDQKRQIAHWKDCPWVVLYGDGTLDETASEDTPLVMLTRKFMAEAPESCRIYILQGLRPS
ncbi:hypothetical protein GQ54DRAFT_114019 [Martensiomyces pterosporus]|nr:hypothetical protein GQ54DRAFT_114019 [Martensiomyces pterosporus]